MAQPPTPSYPRWQSCSWRFVGHSRPKISVPDSIDANQKRICVVWCLGCRANTMGLVCKKVVSGNGAGGDLLNFAHGVVPGSALTPSPLTNTKFRGPHQTAEVGMADPLFVQICLQLHAGHIAPYWGCVNPTLGYPQFGLGWP